jgi:hypothetical protein
MRILLGQLGCYGDCLFATTVARQIKEDYPGCHLTWVIGSYYESILINNPHVDKVWSVPMTHRDDHCNHWHWLKPQIDQMVAEGKFDKVFITQVAPFNWHRFDGCPRSSLFRNYPGKITVPIAPVIRLTSDEIAEVTQFAQANQLSRYRHVILFECNFTSGQSFIDANFTQEAIRGILEQNADACVIVTHPSGMLPDEPRVINAGPLKFRHFAELTKHCTLFIGCSSGITWLTTSDAAKDLPRVLLISKTSYIHASMAYDSLYYFKSIPHNYLEVHECSPHALVDLVHLFCTEKPIGTPSLPNVSLYNQMNWLFQYHDHRLSLFHTSTLQARIEAVYIRHGLQNSCLYCLAGICHYTSRRVIALLKPLVANVSCWFRRIS